MRNTPTTMMCMCFLPYYLPVGLGGTHLSQGPTFSVGPVLIATGLSAFCPPAPKLHPFLLFAMQNGLWGHHHNIVQCLSLFPAIPPPIIGISGFFFFFFFSHDLKHGLKDEFQWSFLVLVQPILRSQKPVFSLK